MKSILPDKYPDYSLKVGKGGRTRRVRTPHHDVDALEFALYYLKKARKAYLKKNPRYTEYLGRALHYLQDYSVDPHKKILWFNIRSNHTHDAREDVLTLMYVPDEAIEEGLRQSCTPSNLKKILYGTTPKKDPAEIIYLATYLTTIAVRAVVNPDRTPNLEESYKKALKIHVALLPAPFLLTLLNFTATTLLVAALASAIMHKLDIHYHKWKFEYEWFH